MNGTKKVIIDGAVEGLLDEAILKLLISFVGAEPGTIYGKEGKDYIKRNIRAFNNAAKYQKYIILVDLDLSECPAELISTWFDRSPAKFLCFRIAVRSIESWLLADKEHVARALSISPNKIPDDTDAIPNPKQKIINLVRKSRSKSVKSDIIPTLESGRKIGPGYNQRFLEFLSHSKYPWRPEVAISKSESLRSCINCLQNLRDMYINS